MITVADRNLMARVGRILRDRAAELEAEHGANWAASPESRQAKRLFDRLHREERDLAALRLRLNGGDARVRTEPT